MSLEPVVLFFVLGLAAGLLRSDLKIPGSIYDALSIYLLLAIGLKGGVKLAEQATPGMLLDGVLIIGAAILIPLVAFPILRYLGKLKRADAASLAAHYGSVSVVTFSIGVAFLAQAAQEYEGYLIVFLVLLEVPALMIGVILARYGAGQVRWGRMLHEVFFGKSIFLLLGGMIIGYVAGPQGIAPLDKVFFDLFKGALAIFLLEMGLVAAGRLADLRAYGVFLIGFGIVMPILSASLGTAVGWMLGLSVGGTMLLAALYASASYIAAPAAMRIAVPEANPGLSIGAALGVTFPFNILIGIPLYYWMAQTIHQIGA